MASQWNQWLDRQLAVNLTETERRLSEALARLLLGWRRNGHGLGERLIRETARLDGRSFTRARDGLVEKGLVVYTPPTRPGRGHRGTYTLVLSEKPVEQRAISGEEKPAVERAIPNKRKSRSSGREKPAPQRARIGTKQRKNVPAAPDNGDIVRKAFDAYVGAGGSVQLERERGALARSVTSTVKAGFDEGTIIAACRELGRAREFPGLLRQRAEVIVAAGGACEWPGLDRSQLTLEQLGACACRRCAEWAAAKEPAAI